MLIFSASPLSLEQELLTRHLLARLLRPSDRGGLGRKAEVRERRGEIVREGKGQGRREGSREGRKRREDQDSSPSIVYPQVSQQVGANILTFPQSLAAIHHKII